MMAGNFAFMKKLIYKNYKQMEIWKGENMSRLKFTKEVVIEAWYEFMKKEGFQNISVRKIANYLKCSTAPIYFNFSTVDDL